MTFIESQPSACSGQKRLSKAEPGMSQFAEWRPAGKRTLCGRKDRCTRRSVARHARKRGCAQCAHPGAPDSVVLASDWAGLGRFSGEWRICKGRSPVRVLPRARVFPVQGLFSLRVWTFCSLVGPFGGLFHCWLIVWPAASLLASLGGPLSFVTCSWTAVAWAT
jgi:hypothetical protein